MIPTISAVIITPFTTPPQLRAAVFLPNETSFETVWHLLRLSLLWVVTKSMLLWNNDRCPIKLTVLYGIQGKRYTERWGEAAVTAITHFHRFSCIFQGTLLTFPVTLYSMTPFWKTFRPCFTCRWAHWKRAHWKRQAEETKMHAHASGVARPSSQF